MRWTDIDWPTVRREVRRLQCRIAKAVKEGRWNKVRALQYLLTRSRHAKLMAVQRVTSNKGRHARGVDGVVWHGARVKGQAVGSLRRCHCRRLQRPVQAEFGSVDSGR